MINLIDALQDDFDRENDELGMTIEMAEGTRLRAIGIEKELEQLLK